MSDQVLNDPTFRWVLWGTVVFLALCAVYLVTYVVLYRRLGYPMKLAFLKSIHLRDGIEDIRIKIEPAIQDGFQIKEQSSEELVLKKQYESPNCTMTIEFHRPQGACPWSTTHVIVKCHKHPWLNWKSGGGSNSYRRVAHA